MTVLHATGLKHRYGRRWVLRNLEVEVKAGEVVGLLGPNGAGKTTAFRILAGQLRSSGATITLGSTDLTNTRLWTRAKRGLAYIPQSSTVLEDLTVSENIDFGLARFKRSERPAKREAVIQEFGLTHLAIAKGRTLSGGERRRVELARAFAAEPKILLADEPFAALDPLTTNQVCREVRRFADNGVGVLLTDHNVAQTLHVCDRVYILHEGRLIFVGTPEEVRQDPTVRETYLGNRFFEAATAVANRT